MKITQKFFNQNLQKNYLFETSPKIAVAVSGGPDSMCLVYLLNNWIKKKKGTLIALIVDHKIRKNSLKEATYINKYLKKLKIRSKIIQVNKHNIIKKNMNEARKNRFKNLIKYCEKKNILHLFLGHHHDDNLETYLLRKIAGSNFEGLRSIQNKSLVKQLRILRPLLDFKKKDILAFNYNNKINFIEDSSNYDFKYSRVLVRNFLSENPEFAENIIANFENIKKYYPLFKQMIFQVFNKVIYKIYNNSIVVENKNFFIQDTEIQNKIVEIIYKFLQPKRRNPRYQQIQLMIKLIKSKENLKTNLAGIIVKKDKFFISFG